MAIFNTESYGKPISVELSNYIREWTTLEQRKQLAKNVSFSTLQKVITRKLNVTENNVNDLLEVLKKAIQNYTKKDKEYKKQINEIQSKFNLNI